MLRLFCLILLIMLTSCSGLDIKAPEPEKERETIFGGPLKFSTEKGGFSVGSSSTTSSKFNILKKDGSTGNIPVNALLWQASLDTIDFIPLYTVDAYGGVIVTDWFINDDNNKFRYKKRIINYKSDINTIVLRNQQVGHQI